MRFPSFAASAHIFGWSCWFRLQERTPSYCDRILWKSTEALEALGQRLKSARKNPWNSEIPWEIPWTIVQEGVQEWYHNGPGMVQEWIHPSTLAIFNRYESLFSPPVIMSQATFLSQCCSQGMAVQSLLASAEQVSSSDHKPVYAHFAAASDEDSPPVGGWFLWHWWHARNTWGPTFWCFRFGSLRSPELRFMKDQLSLTGIKQV